jgi:hypothetical protein
MDASVQPNTPRKSKHHDASGAAGASADNTPREGANGATPSVPTVTIEIAGLNITLPLKFRPGHVLTENQAKILDAAYARQFTNNQNANAEARAKRFAKDAKAEDAPLSAAALAALYTDYEPAVGGGVRQSGLETLRHATAWRFWTTLVAEHNKSVSTGGVPVITKAGTKQVTIAPAPRKRQDQTDADAKATREVFDADRALFIGRLLEHSVYGPRIAALVEAELAAKAAEKAAPQAPAADTVVADSLLD